MLYNEQASGRMDFTPEEIEAGKLTTFVNFLMSMGCEIRLATDGYCYAVEYIESFYRDEGLEFTIVDHGQENLYKHKEEENGAEFSS